MLALPQAEMQPSLAVEKSEAVTPRPRQRPAPDMERLEVVVPEVFMALLGMTRLGLHKETACGISLMKTLPIRLAIAM